MNMPQTILNLLTHERLCCLATSHGNQPHLSLMNFTFVAKERTLILSSRRHTRKVQQLQENPRVALLVTPTGNASTQDMSCTLYGLAHVFPPGQGEPYRTKHKKQHPTMGTFIDGGDIAIITIRIDYATVANVQDQVRTWEFDSQA